VDLDLTLAKQAYALADRWDAARVIDIPETSFDAADMDNFNSNQKVVFLERLQALPPLPADHIAHLGSLYKVAGTSNAEIRFRFYELALRDRNSVPDHLAEDAVRWVVGDDGSGVIKGRAKFCRPVFRSTAKIDRDLAVKYFEKHKAEFHPIARKLIEKVSWLQQRRASTAGRVTNLTLCSPPCLHLAGHWHPLTGSSCTRFIGSIDMNVYSVCIRYSNRSVGSLLDVSPDATDIRVTVWLRWYRKFRLFSSWRGI
jgi:hypothetical protein